MALPTRQQRINQQTIESNAVQHDHFTAQQQYPHYFDPSQHLHSNIHPPLMYSTATHHRKHSLEANMEARQDTIQYCNPYCSHSHPAGWSGTTQYHNTSFSFQQQQSFAGNEPMVTFGWHNDTVNTPSSRSASYVSHDSMVSDSGDRICDHMANDVNACEPARFGTDTSCLKYEEVHLTKDCMSVSNPTPPPEDDRMQQDFVNPFSSNGSYDKRKRTKRSLSSHESSPETTQRPAPGFRSSPSSHTFTMKASPTSRASKHRSKAAQAHSLVEKKYRENLNAKMSQLHDLLQDSYFTSPDPTSTEAITRTKQNLCLVLNKRTSTASDEIKSESTYKKGKVLDDALTYVQRAETELSSMAAEIERLQQQIRGMKEEKEMASHTNPLQERRSQHQRLPPQHQMQAQSMAQAQAVLRKMNRGAGVRDCSECTLLQQMQAIGLRVGVS